MPMKNTQTMATIGRNQTINNIGQIIQMLNGQNPEQVAQMFMQQQGTTPEVFEQAKQFANQNINALRSIGSMFK